jgi:hypothetical protein
MKIFVVVGMPASGKNIARMYAEEKGIRPDPESMARLSDELRGKDGMGVTRLAVAAALAGKDSVVFLEGMRSLQEIELIRKEPECSVVAFIAPRKLRKERVMSRGRADDSADAFDDRDRRELSYGASIPIALADEYILNTGSMGDALDDLHAIVTRYM